MPMYTLENRNYIRITNITVMCGTKVVRAVFWGHVEVIVKTGGNVLTLIQSNLENLRRKMSQDQMKKLTLWDGISDIDSWDLSLLVNTATAIFRTLMSGDVTNGLLEILFLRNDLAHNANAELDIYDYEFRLQRITETLNKLLRSSFISQDLHVEVQDTLEKIKSETFDVQLSITDIKQMSATDEKINDILGRLGKVEKLIPEENDRVIKAVEKQGQRIIDALPNNKDLIDFIRQAIPQLDAKCMQVVGVRLTLDGGSEERISVLSDFLTDLFNEVDRRTSYSENTEKLREVVEEISRTIKDQYNSDIVCARKSSVLLLIRCCSYQGLIGLLGYVYSETFQRQLHSLSKALSEEKGVTCTITADITDDSLRELLLKFTDGQEDFYQKEIYISVRCKSVKGILHLWHLFQEDGAKPQLDRLSRVIKELFGNEVSIKAEVDLIEMKTALNDICSGNYGLCDKSTNDVPSSVDHSSGETEYAGSVKDSYEDKTEKRIYGRGPYSSRLRYTIRSRFDWPLQIAKDEVLPRIIDCAILPNGNIILLDEINSKLEKYDGTGRLMSSLRVKVSMSGKICAMDNMWILLGNGAHIQFIDTREDMRAGRRVILNHPCVDLVSDGSEILMVSNYRLYKYMPDCTNQMILFSVNLSRGEMFHNIDTSETYEYIYILDDKNKSIFVLGMKGVLIKQVDIPSSITDSFISSAVNNCLFVCNKNDRHLKCLGGHVVDETEDKFPIHTMTFDRQNSLLVFCRADQSSMVTYRLVVEK